MSISVAIFSRGAGNQQYGLGQDAKLMELSLRELTVTGKSRVTVVHKDPYTYIGACFSDINIHLEVPCRAAFPWAKTNIIIPNSEWWLKDEWSWVLEEPSVVFLHKTQHSLGLFKKGQYIGWRCPVALTSSEVIKKKQFLYVVGGSKHKQTAASVIAEAWLPEYTPLIIVSQNRGLEKSNVVWKTGFLPAQELKQLQEESAYHVVASQAEGFGYTMAEALSMGAKVLWTDISVYKELWSELLGTNGLIMTSAVKSETMLDNPCVFSKEAVADGLLSIDLQVPEKSAAFIQTRNKQFRKTFADVWSKITAGLLKKTRVTVGLPSEPKVGVITLVKNRPGWFVNAVRNMGITNYPRDKLVWVIVDDGEQRVDSFIDRAKGQLPGLQIEYVSLSKSVPIGEKRNLGIKRAIESCSDVSVFAFMDDDDHYPEKSLTTRVSWLLSYKCNAVYCSTLPMYDTTHYISAMNVPPLDLAPRKRISEATLCFTRAFWEQKGFPSTVSVAEGEEFLLGRELETVEMPPTDIIVSFLHGKNFTSRRVPNTTEPNGCHYGFSDEYFTMISQLGGATA